MLDRSVLSTILSEAGHETLVAADPKEALGILERQSVDVVITDLEMPNIHGLEFISVLREMTPKPPVIAVSSTGVYQLEMAQAIGAKLALSKPVGHDELIAAVEQALGAEPEG